MRRVRALLLALCFLGLQVPAAGSAAAASGAPVDRVIQDSRIGESSGLARSLLHPGVLWTHNDSGNPARIFAIEPNGRTAAVISVRTPYDTDWEAIATLLAPGGRPMIAIADIGDNDAVRRWVEILLVPEPVRLANATVRPSRVLRFRYPGGPRDAEALLADPRDGRLYVVHKTLLGSTLYAVPRPEWPGRTGGSSRFEIQRVASLDADLVTDGTFLAGGRFLLRGYGSVSLLALPSGSQRGTVRALAVRRLPFQDQGESITLTADGKRALVGSEGEREPVLRVPIPVAGTDPTTEFGARPSSTAAATSPTSPSGGRHGPVVHGSRSGGPVSGNPARTLALGAGAALALLAAIAVLVLRRH